MDNVLKLLGIVSWAVGLAFLRLHVAIKLWQYIVVPLGAPTIGLMTAFGLSLIVGHLTTDYKTEAKPDEKEIVLRLTKATVGSLIVWGLGYWIFG